jgi:hypothetical protein
MSSIGTYAVIGAGVGVEDFSRFVYRLEFQTERSQFGGTANSPDIQMLPMVVLKRPRVAKRICLDGVSFG